MDTKKDSAVSDVPTFKVARVGNNRKRKGGAFSFLRSGGTRAAWSGATGGSGAGGAAVNALGMTFSKAMLSVMITAVLGVAGVQYGKMQNAANAGSAAPKKQAVFSDKGDIKLEGDTSNLPSTANTIPNSLGYLSGSRDGLTPEERAKKEAEAAAAAEAQRLADEEAAKKAAAEAGKPAVDPNALLASAQADGKGRGSAFGKKFGALSSSMGGGSSLSGGAGLSGGVNRQFGSGGGMGSISKGSKGQLSALSGGARPTYSKAGTSKLAASNAKGFARKQLANANAYSRRGATAGKGENAAADAASAFDNNPGAGNVISGPGIGAGHGSSTGADSTPNSVDNGGPTGGGDVQPLNCGPNAHPNSDGGCTPNDTQGVNKTPNQWMYTTAMALMMLITVLAAIAMASHSIDWMAGAGLAIREAIAAVMVGVGLVLAALGAAMIAATGDKVAGGIIAAVGLYTSYQAYTSPEITTGELMKQFALKMFVPSIVGGFAASMAHKPAASAQ